ncbi:MAG: undecaprenyl-diphosphate phosphatase [Melioribacteraceae bacterium]
MNLVEAIVLGIIQGLTEFLPISSTGHLTVAGKLMNLISDQNPQKWTSFIAVIQLGTLLAVFVYFWRDIISIIRDFLRDNWFNRVKFKDQSMHAKMGWYLVIATLPVVVIGLGFKDIIEGVFTKNLYVIAISLIVLALILAFAERIGKLNRKNENINWMDALLIGFAQAIALIPGSSRSGTTITAGLFLGFDRETAARFSFLMSIPAVAASGLLQFYQAAKYIDQTGFVALIVATIVSAVVGYLSIEFLLRYLKTKSMLLFIVYRIVVGIIIIVLLANGVINQ